jgi:hypothetical protein
MIVQELSNIPITPDLLIGLGVALGVALLQYFRQLMFLRHMSPLDQAYYRLFMKSMAMILTNDLKHSSFQDRAEYLNKVEAFMRKEARRFIGEDINGKVD